MDFKWSDELESMRKMAYDFAVKNIKPTMEEDEKEHKYRPELLKKMGDQGMFGCLAPEEYGGLGLEEGHLAATLMATEFARVSPSWGLPFNLQMNGPQNVLLKFGNEEQKEQFLPGLIAGTSGGCFAITEPNSGSDVASMRTTATETDDGFILNGTKTWISGVPYCRLRRCLRDDRQGREAQGHVRLLRRFHTRPASPRGRSRRSSVSTAPPPARSSLKKRRSRRAHSWENWARDSRSA